MIVYFFFHSKRLYLNDEAITNHVNFIERTSKTRATLGYGQAGTYVYCITAGKRCQREYQMRSLAVGNRDNGTVFDVTVSVSFRLHGIILERKRSRRKNNARNVLYIVQ